MRPMLLLIGLAFSLGAVAAHPVPSSAPATGRNLIEISMKLIIVLLALFLSFGTMAALARSLPTEEPKNVGISLVISTLQGRLPPWLRRMTNMPVQTQMQMNRRERKSGEKICKAAIKSKKEECESMSAGKEKKRCKAEVVDLKEHCKFGAEEPKKQKCKPLPVGLGGLGPQVQENGCP
ncbi:hypothetical protein CBOM_07101 [Ceraceosorus bombacis]|uniref:Uncharacterized protein n=1 Tax=Ceraceosorus bombacis TaxID=401625 RepID=A0A0P1B880_9BASI|nr:hypothetical protein CBOM_07101 [Ceraceosorus bombacis]